MKKIKFIQERDIYIIYISVDNSLTVCKNNKMKYYIMSPTTAIPLSFTAKYYFKSIHRFRLFFQTHAYYSILHDIMSLIRALCFIRTN